MLIWYFSNNLDIYDYVAKLPEQQFSVWAFSNPGDKILFLLKFNEARISEWNLYNEVAEVEQVSPLSLKRCVYAWKLRTLNYSHLTVHTKSCTLNHAH